MKKVYCFFITISLLISTISSLQAQTTEGKEFWITFGQISVTPMIPATVPFFDFVIRIVGGNTPTSGIIYFTNLDTSVPFDIAPYEIYNYSLDNTEKYAVYNTVSEYTTNFSIRITITTSNPVSVFASKKFNSNYDATNILPVTALGTEYYAISHNIYGDNRDAYAVVATQNNTHLFHNGTEVGILDAGDVYYRASDNITGDHITSNKPVAFSAQCRLTSIPGGQSDILFQQLAPVNTWGKTFFVPVSVIGTEYVRIVASENNTTIEQTGGTIVTGTGGQSTLENLQAGQFIELEILLSNNGCYIEADKPVGVCSFMKSGGVQNPTGSGSQVWIPAIEQSIFNVLMAPFAQSHIHNHYALVVTPTSTKNNTMVSIGGGSPIPLSGGIWYDHAAGGTSMSFYNFPLTNLSASYTFSNPAKIIVFGYGNGTSGWPSSYYYLAGSAMRNLSAAFTANNIPYNELSNHIFCEHDITFVANVEGIHPNQGSLKWYINDGHYSAATDSLTWSKNFATGNYAIKMSILFEDGSMKTYEDTLKIRTCEAEFYANNVHYLNLPDTTFCDKNVYFRAEIEGELHTDPGRIKWFIGGVEYMPARDLLQWYESFETGEYEIKMEVRFENNETATIQRILNMNVFWIKMRNIRY